MKTLNAIFFILTVIVTSFALSACNDTDDVSEIFLNKTWKLTQIYLDNGKTKPPIDTDWGTEDERKKSYELLLNNKETYTISFSGFEKNNQIEGEYTGRATNSEIEGQWSADGESRHFDTTQQVIDDNDPLGRAFIKALSTAKGYGGDSKNLQIFFKDGLKDKYLLFRVADPE